jgi:3-phenylpropionate/trans-cinnamate dioxygenase ferredoxin reductase subunit
LRTLGAEVVAIDGGSVPLQRVLGERIGSAVAALHRDHGVDLRAGEGVTAFEGNGGVERVVTRSGAAIECDFAVVGLGVDPNVDVVAGSGIELENGIVVDERCRTNVADVYAAGDVANHAHPVFGRRIRVEHWQNARRHGAAAAHSMLGRTAPYDEVPWFWSDQYDANLQYAGHHVEWDDLVVRGSIDARDFLAFYLQAGRVQAAVAMNRGRELRHAIPLIKSGEAVDAARLGDEQTSLDDLSSAGRAL